MKSLPFTFTAAALLGAVAFTAHAQAPAAGAAPGQPAAGAAAGRGGRGGGGGGAGAPALSAAQQLAVTREMVLPDALTAAQAAALAALNRASLSLPVNPADLEAKAQALATAELALAGARAEALTRVQESLRPLTPAQAVAAGRGGGGAANNWLAAYNDHTGFTQLFDGTTLNGWEGEQGVWDVKDGAIHRHQTIEPRNFVDFGQYHLHYKEVFGDFDLKIEYKLRSGNAGIHYRSRMESGVRAQPGEVIRMVNGIPLRPVAAAKADPMGKLPPEVRTLNDALNAGLLPRESAPGVPIPYGNGTGHPWQVSGYQFDITAGGAGNWYEGQGRGTVASAGDIIQLLPNNGRAILGRVADNPWAQWGRPGDWNQVQIIARGNTVVHMLNGRVVLVGIDDNPEARALKGIISLQLEGPADNEVWYRNIWIKKL